MSRPTACGGKGPGCRHERIGEASVRRATSLVFAVAVALALPPVASAETGDASTWSIGVGVGQLFSPVSTPSAAIASVGMLRLPSGVVSFPPASAATTSMQASPRFGVSFQLERRIGEASWLVGAVSGHHSRETGVSPMLDQRTYVDTIEWLSTRTEYGAALGLRHVFNPGGVVELGGLVAFDVVFADLGERETLAGYDTELGAVSSRLYETEATGWYAGARLGLTAEKTLTRDLALRLTMSVLNAGWNGTRATATAEGGSKDEVKASDFRVGLQLMPVIELRLAL